MKSKSINQGNLISTGWKILTETLTKILTGCKRTVTEKLIFSNWNDLIDQ